jgi:alpha-1,6-mannosyltransferase
MTAIAPIEHRLAPPLAPSHFDLAKAQMPVPLRPRAGLGVLDITKWFGETSGGVKTYLLQKARYVEDRESLRQVLVIPGARDSITSGDGVRCYRLRGPRIPTQRPYRFMLATRSIRRIVEHERPDIIEVGSPFLVPWITRRAARRFDIPLVMFFHSNVPRTICAFPERASPMRQRAHNAMWRYVKRLNQEFEATIVASDFMADDLRAHGALRVVQIPLGVDLAHFHPRRRADAPRTRARLGLPIDAPVLGYVGRFAREKELEILVDAWETIERQTDAHLTILGDGPARRRLHARSHGSRVVWLPYQHDRNELADIMAALDIFISPGSIETFGLSALEAAASGTPVITADQGGVSEQIRRSGGGALFTAGDAAALAEVAVRLVQHSSEHSRLGALGRDYAEREHAWDRVFDRIFDVYRRVLA